ncbi:unnamed protein product [Enterobius vermicularis]|uniref:DH domain-containing protein n=1 Tax=Enterobius vermicularis TaxID=51028 RepID=A0A0N4VAC9_ENTVE|nr:unnamed protein product [Enterobius vermicularis]
MQEQTDKEPKSLVQDENSMIREIIATEAAYLECIRVTVEVGLLEYMPLFVTSEPNKVKLMKRLQSLVFGAIEDVYVYHTNMIYPDIIVLKDVEDARLAEKFAEAIAEKKDYFDAYGFYVQARPASKMLLAYNLGQHKSLQLIDEALSVANKTREELERVLQEPINRVRKYAKALAKIISKMALDDPEIDLLSDAFAAVDLEEAYKTAVAEWAAERIKDCPVDLQLVFSGKKLILFNS